MEDAMDDNRMKVLLVEFYTWHDECLYTTCQLLKQSGVEVSLVLNEKIKERTESLLNKVVAHLSYFPFKKGIKGYFALFKLYLYAIRGGFTHVYFNTAGGSEAWKFFLLPLPKHIKTIGTLHNIAKLTKSIGQKLITSKIDGYILLSDILLKQYQSNCQLPVASVYPIIYPETITSEIEKPEGEIWLAIPGAVSLKRRDYLSLFSSQSYNKHIKFIILGNRHKADGDIVYEKVKALRMESNFIFFEDYVSDRVFYGYIKKCDYLMPLVHPHEDVYSKYVSEKISGTYNLAFAYRKPMLCPQEMSVYEDFKDSSLFYDSSNIAEFVNSLTSSVDNQFYCHAKWDTEKMRERLIDFLRNI